MEKSKVKNGANYGVSRYFLLVMLLSFLGWAFETLFVFFNTGKIHDQGFMTLPFCPIYGCSLFAMYLLAGTPDEGRGLLKRADNRALRYALYLLIAFLVPSIAELAVGFFFDKTFGIWLWSYQALPMHINGYVCLPVSLAWSALIFVFMKWLFPPIKKVIGRLPRVLAKAVAILLLIATAIDFLYNFTHV